jgi:flagellar M-ring protein FliF
MAAAGDTQTTSEALEVRQQIERDLVAKINTTLEPLLGASQFRAGASVDFDLTSGEQQEETFNPDQSVMVSSQKSEDSNDRTLPGIVPDRAPTGGIPGTASNLPHPPAQLAGASGSSHRTENVTYQSSRIVKHTRIPQGVIRRMSLSVLVGQPAHWEGAGKTRRRVVVPPSPETLKTIRDLVSGVTGFSTERGDQLIVETLPFESSVEAADPGLLSSGSTTKPATGPAWLESLAKYQNTLMVAVGLLTGFFILFRVAMSFTSRGRKQGKIEVSRELPAAEYESQTASSLVSSPVAVTMPGPGYAPAALGAADHESANRIRVLAQDDPGVAANVLRMWIQNQRA